MQIYIFLHFIESRNKDFLSIFLPQFFPKNGIIVTKDAGIF